MTKGNIDTNFYVYEENPNVGITKFFMVPTLEGAKLLAGRLNCALAVSDVPITIDIANGKLVMLPIGAAPQPSANVPAVPAKRGGRRGRKARTASTSVAV